MPSAGARTSRPTPRLSTVRAKAKKLQQRCSAPMSSANWSNGVAASSWSRVPPSIAARSKTWVTRSRHSCNRPGNSAASSVHATGTGGSAAGSRGAPELSARHPQSASHGPSGVCEARPARMRCRSAVNAPSSDIRAWESLSLSVTSSRSRSWTGAQFPPSQSGISCAISSSEQPSNLARAMKPSRARTDSS